MFNHLVCYIYHYRILVAFDDWSKSSCCMGDTWQDPTVCVLLILMVKYPCRMRKITRVNHTMDDGMLLVYLLDLGQTIAVTSCVSEG
jgi:hypothetical protein